MSVYRPISKWSIDEIVSYIDSTAERFIKEKLKGFIDYIKTTKEKQYLGTQGKILYDVIHGLIARKVLLSIDINKEHIIKLPHQLSTINAKLSMLFSFWIVRLLVSKNSWRKIKPKTLEFLAPSLYYFYLSYRDRPIIIPETLIFSLINGLSNYVFEPQSILVKYFYKALLIPTFRREYIEQLVEKINDEINNTKIRRDKYRVSIYPYRDIIRGLAYALALKSLEDYSADWSLDLSKIITADFIIELLTLVLNLISPLESQSLDRVTKYTLVLIEDLKSYNIHYSINIGRLRIRISNLRARNPVIYRKYKNKIERIFTKPDKYLVLDILTERAIAYESPEALLELKKMLSPLDKIPHLAEKTYEIIKVYLSELEI